MKETSPFQFGFKPGTGIGEAILRLNMKIRQLQNNDEPSGILFIDFKKAFDSVNRIKLYKKMETYGIAHEVIKLVEAIHNNSRTELGGEYFKVSCGVPQGSPLSSFLFNIYIDDLLIDLSRSQAFPITFADDLTASFEVKAHFYQSNDKINGWSRENEMDVNKRKSAILFVTKKEFKQKKGLEHYPETSSYKNLGTLINKSTRKVR